MLQRLNMERRWDLQLLMLLLNIFDYIRKILVFLKSIPTSIRMGCQDGNQNQDFLFLLMDVWMRDNFIVTSYYRIWKTYFYSWTKAKTDNFILTTVQKDNNFLKTLTEKLHHLFEVESYSGGFGDSLVCIQKNKQYITTYLLMWYTYSLQTAYFSDIFIDYLQLLCEKAHAYKDKQWMRH